MGTATTAGDGTTAIVPETTKILLDTPARRLSPETTALAEAFARIIEESAPRFAIGIFGGWGSGKTTLMQAIESKLNRDVSIVVQFNAWRFEREEHLLVPLLDSVRVSLATWANSRPATTEAEKTRAERVRTVARRIGRVVRAFGSGLSGEVGVGAAKVKLDAGKVIDALGDPDQDDAVRPQSLYFAGFQELAAALEVFAGDGAARIVVFVDDLDRCLPSNALQVLESMKLFFDLPGFVFVVGLDEQVVQRAVRSKLGDDGRESTGDANADAARFGRDYVKKIFQVPYTVTPALAEQLGGLLETMCADAEIEGKQLTDLTGPVKQFLTHVAVDGRINPREVKRFINAYTLQMLVRPGLDRATVLALQTITFRDDWAATYGALVADAPRVTEAMKRHRDGDMDALDDLWPATTPIPPDLLRFVRSDQATPLVSGENLDRYLFSLQSARGSNPELIRGLGHVARLQRLIREVADVDALGDTESRRIAREIDETVETIASEPLSGIPSSDRSRFGKAIQRLSAASGELDPKATDVTGPIPPGLGRRLNEAIADVSRELHLLRSLSVQAS